MRLISKTANILVLLSLSTKFRFRFQRRSVVPCQFTHGVDLWINSKSSSSKRNRMMMMMMSTASSSSSDDDDSITGSSGYSKEQPQILRGRDDEHGGVIVEMTDMPPDFSSLLTNSLSLWSLQGKKGIWLKLPIELVNLVEPAVKEGFYFHHAEPKYVMLVRWISETSNNTLPANASHRVGIGAFVMNDKREVLVVQEKSGILRGTGVWKFPTGVVDGGEDICDAAVREVKEETGIEAKFVEVLAFRQSHKSFFDKSDLFFVCLLQPLSFDIQTQESEIEAAQWMPFEEYAAQKFVQENELLRYLTKICLAKKNGSYSGFSTVPTTTNFDNKKSYLYLNDHSLLKEEE